MPTRTALQLEKGNRHGHTRYPSNQRETLVEVDFNVREEHGGIHNRSSVYACA
jgi:hypothetical protein